MAEQWYAPREEVQEPVQLTATITYVRAEAGQRGMAHHLCETFRACSTDVFSAYQAGRAVNLVPLGGELDRPTPAFHSHDGTPQNGSGPTVLRAGRSTPNGADWEWWFKSSSGYEGMRIQAKRRDPRSRGYGIRKKVGKAVSSRYPGQPSKAARHGPLLRFVRRPSSPRTLTRRHTWALPAWPIRSSAVGNIHVARLACDNPFAPFQIRG